MENSADNLNMSSRETQIPKKSLIIMMQLLIERRWSRVINLFGWEQCGTRKGGACDSFWWICFFFYVLLILSLLGRASSLSVYGFVVLFIRLYVLFFMVLSLWLCFIMVLLLVCWRWWRFSTNCHDCVPELFHVIMKSVSLFAASRFRFVCQHLGLNKLNIQLTDFVLLYMSA